MGTGSADKARHSRANGQHALVGAYALDAVPGPDRAKFEKHLQSCEQCRDDVHGLREATARLASAAAIPPRPELRERTVQAAARTLSAVSRISGPMAGGGRAGGCSEPGRSRRGPGTGCCDRGQPGWLSALWCCSS